MAHRDIGSIFSPQSPFPNSRTESLARWTGGLLLVLVAGAGIIACDRFGSDDGNHPPSVQIVAPEDGATVSEGTEVRFEGEVSDQDREVFGGSMAWRSSIDGRIGVGRETSSSTLSAGEHEIWLIAHDNEGASDSASVSLTVEEVPSPSDLPYRYERTFSNLQFDRPTNMEPGPDGERFYVTEQRGTIQVIPADTGATDAQMFLDLTDRVLLKDDHSAEGLLGFALDPAFAQNGYFYVLYTAEGPHGGRTYTADTTTGIRSVLSRFRASGPTRATPGSETVLLDFDQPYIFHNGGQLAFGPQDGLLYVSMGDGGKWGDPDDRAQDTSTLHGTILRIDPDGSTGNRPYGIPNDNPFVGTAGRGEIYAYGFRNVWRFSFGPDGRLWGGDVGQDTWEEVNIIEKGKNYGWDHREGAHCFEPETGCRTDGLTDPIWDYDHSQGRAVTGGYVYRGSRLPDLAGTYIYGDHTNTRVWSLSFSGDTVTDNRLLAENPALRRTEHHGGVATFAEGTDGHLFLLALNGAIYHLVPRDDG